MIRVATWPPWYAPNRYIELFHRALEPLGVDHLRDLPLDARAMSRAGAHVVHLHWAEPAWQSRGRFQWQRRRGVAALRGFLDEAARHGLVVVWTVHNVRPHERGGAADDAALRLLHERARLRIFHSEHARGEALALFGGRGDTLVMPHGNYDGALAEPRDRGLVRAELGVDASQPLLLCAGQVRAYKGVRTAIDALDEGLAARGCRLLVAGRPMGAAGRELARLARARAALLLELSPLRDDRFSDLLHACDVVVLPYRSVTGSGALLAALTMSRPVATTPLDYFREALAPEPLAGEIAADDSAPAFARAVERCLDDDVDARRAAARRLADRYAWARVVPPVAQWLRANVG